MRYEPTGLDAERPERVAVTFSRGSWTDPLIVCGVTSDAGILAACIAALALRLPDAYRADAETLSRRIMRGDP